MITHNNKIRVMVVDDSLVFDRFLSEELPRADSHIQIVGSALNPLDAINKIPTLKPDVITMDIEMPKMTGIEFLTQLLPKYPIPVILVSSLNLSVFDALSHGAVDFVRKPDMSNQNTKNIFIRNLVNKIRIASFAKVKIPVTSNSATTRTQSSTSIPLRLRPSMALNSKVIAIGASTGGTEATLAVLKNLPADTPGIVITQHMPEGFTQMYAERLNRLCKMEVKEAKNGDKIERGRALLAPGNLQMKVVKMGSSYTVNCFPGQKVSGHRPSVDVLFQSMASAVGNNGIGIILTGMGRDGADGLLAMRRAGAYTIGQDKESCVVYGMPMEAHKIGAVAIQASCNNIPNVLMNFLNK